jgi:hypothetical protein
MGVLYTVLPLDDELATYLRDEGVHVPPCPKATRNPTLLEVRAVCDRLDGFGTRYFVSQDAKHWQASIEGAANPEEEPWTLLNVSDFTGREEEPQKIWFEKGWPSLILRILHGLVGSCGHLVLIPDTGEPPLVVSADVSFEELDARWNSTREVWEVPGDPAAG